MRTHLTFRLLHSFAEFILLIVKARTCGPSACLIFTFICFIIGFLHRIKFLNVTRVRSFIMIAPLVACVFTEIDPNEKSDDKIYFFLCFCSLTRTMTDEISFVSLQVSQLSQRVWLGQKMGIY